MRTTMGKALFAAMAVNAMMNPWSAYYGLCDKGAYRPNCLYWVKTKGKRVKRTKKESKRWTK